MEGVTGTLLAILVVIAIWLFFGIKSASVLLPVLVGNKRAVDLAKTRGCKWDLNGEVEKWGGEKNDLQVDLY